MLLCGHLFHLIPDLLDLILKLLNSGFHLSIFQYHIRYFPVLRHHIHILEAPPHPIIVVRNLHKHLLELRVLLLVDLQEVLLALQVLLQLLDLVQVDLHDILLLVLRVVDDLLHNEEPRIQLVSFLRHTTQVRLKHLIFMGQLRYSVIKTTSRGGSKGRAIGGQRLFLLPLEETLDDIFVDSECGLQVLAHLLKVPIFGLQVRNFKGLLVLSPTHRLHRCDVSPVLIPVHVIVIDLVGRGCLQTLVGLYWVLLLWGLVGQLVTGCSSSHCFNY